MINVILYFLLIIVFKKKKKKELFDPGYGMLDADWAFWMFNSIGIIYVILAKGSRHVF